MGIILKRIGLIILITHVSAIVGMEKHNWWPNGRDADPTPPNTMDVLHNFIALRVDLLPTDVGVQVWNAIAEGLTVSKEFSINDAVKILERFEDEQDRLDEQEREKLVREDLKFCFFESSSEDEKEIE
jgi:hypothetical protein